MPNPSRQKNVSTGKAPARKARVVSIDFGGHRAKVLARRDELVAENCHCTSGKPDSDCLVASIARRIMLRLPPSFEFDDLLQEGHIGLLSAATRYNPEAHNVTPFSAYARKVITGTIQMSIRRRNFTEATHVSFDTLMGAAHSRERGSHDDLNQSRSLPGGFVNGVEPRAESGIEICIDKKRIVRRIKRERLTDLQAAVLTDYYSISEPSLATVAAYLGIPVWKAQRARVEAIEILQKILDAA